jgi:phospholipase C
MANGKTGLDAIEHVVLLMLENRSYDHILANFPGGVDLMEPGVNSDDQKDYKQQPGAIRVLVSDLGHERENVKRQLDNGNSGFVQDYVHTHPDSTQAERAEVMNYFGKTTLPATHALADNFCICTNWFSSVPGPTWPNRLFALSGTSLGRVIMPSGPADVGQYWHWYTQRTLFDCLDDKQKSWGVYAGDMPLTMLFTSQWEPRNLVNHHELDTFFQHVAAAQLPAFSMIEPGYMHAGATDYHPPHDVISGEKLVARVYDELRKSALWNSTLLVVLFDEHGGFYDHVSPPAAIPPDDKKDEYTFDRLGVRVPCILVSPWVQQGTVDDVFDHTSLLKLLTDKWGLGGLGARTAAAKTPTAAFVAAARNDVPDSISFDLDEQIVESASLTAHQQALVVLSHAIGQPIGQLPQMPAAGSVAAKDAKQNAIARYKNRRAAAKANPPPSSPAAPKGK